MFYRKYKDKFINPILKKDKESYNEKVENLLQMLYD